MTTNDIDAIRKLASRATGTPRATVEALCDEVEQLRAELGRYAGDYSEVGAEVARLRSALALALAGKTHIWDDEKKDWVPISEWAVAS